MTLALRFWPYLAGIALCVAAYAYIAHVDRAARAAQFAIDQAVLDKQAAAVRNATAAAQAADIAHKQAVEAVQAQAVNEVSHDYETRLADVRARYDGLRAALAAHPSGSGATGLPSLPATAGGLDATPAQDRLSPEDALTATEQALQLDALITLLEKLESGPQ